MKPYAYCIHKRGKHLYKNNINDVEWKWSNLSDWYCFNKRLYLTKESAERALETFKTLLMYNNEFAVNEFKIVELFLKDDQI